MDSIVSAMIGGVFSLLGVWLGHYLQNRSRAGEAGRSPAANALEPLPGKQAHPLRARRWGRDILSGFLLLTADISVLAVVVTSLEWDKPHRTAWFENVFAFVTVGAVPIYALYLIARGFWSLLSRRRAAAQP